ncbi:NIPA-like protein 3, partial [Linnemannia exigua]
LAASIRKRDTPAGIPQSCKTDFDCLLSSRPANWPASHPTIRTGNYACVFPGTGADSGVCQFVVAAGEQCNAASDCAAYAFYSQFNLSTPINLCSPQYCTLESTCGSPWQDKDAPSNHTFSTAADSQFSCCGGQPTASICTLAGSNVDTCQHGDACNFDINEESSDPSQHNGYTLDQMRQFGLGTCQPLNKRNHVWIGVVITLISSTVLNLGLNGQKYALRKHDERRVRKELEMEEEHERWRQELGWTEEQVQEETDRLYELKENRRGKLYRRLKPYMFWRAIFVSKLWAAGLAVFIVGNLGGFVALRFAPQSLTAPLGSISLISNVIIAPLINKEVLGRWDLAGIFFIVAGSVIVVVFSGIVAQDYKLCVLINLFQKPATIAYLSFIAIFMILTYIFIKFVEKNVENEDDMAIGVSSEKQLQQEQRLYRLNSNMSNLSLSQKEQEKRASNHHDRGSSIDAPRGSTTLQHPVRPFLQEQDGLAVNSTISHQTAVSDASGTAVGGDHPKENMRQSIYSTNSGKSSRISVSSLGDAGVSTTKTERRLTFETPRPKESMVQSIQQDSALGGDTGEGTGADVANAERVAGSQGDEGPVPRPGVERVHSMAPSVVSKRSNRRRRIRAGQSEDRQAITLWQRIGRIELIPSLPEDRLIRRNSPLLRFCLPLSYAALGGMMASYTVLFAKSLINLLVTSIFDGQNQFTSALAWVILVVTVVTAVSQVYWINMGLKKYDALLQVPVFFTIWVLLDIVGGGIYYDEFSGFTPTKYVLFCFGVLTVFFGVALLAKRLALLAKEDEMPRHQSASSALASVRRHVHQWVGLVLYNSIYQNILLLHIYRIFKFIYGFIDRSTELSRICGASSSSSFTPLDSLWNSLGQPTSTLVNNIHAGTIVYSNPSSSPSSAAGNGRRASVQVGGATGATASSSLPVPNDPASARSSTESSSSASSVQSSALDSSSAATLAVEQQPELRQRKKRHDSTASSLAHTTAIMDLRQSKAAAGMIYRIGK